MKTAFFALGEIFEDVKRGNFHASSKLEEGDIPLISCATENNGVEGYFKISKEKTFQNCVTIASDGQPLTTFYHPYRFAAKDNVLVCTLKDTIKLSTIHYAIAYLNNIRWRFSYGRKCYENKVKKIKIEFPITEDGKINEAYIETMIKIETEKIIPKQNELKNITRKGEFKLFQIDSLFNLDRGDFHALSKLEEGEYPTVSRIETNNGVVGYFKPPKKAKIYPKGLLTVSTVTGDTFIQVQDFIATDNVVICFPKRKLQTTTLVFIQYMINRMKWRYSYGRQCYKTKFSKTLIYLPIKPDNSIDEDLIEEIVMNTSYWNYFSQNFQVSEQIFRNLLSYM